DRRPEETGIVLLVALEVGVAEVAFDRERVHGTELEFQLDALHVRRNVVVERAGNRSARRRWAVHIDAGLAQGIRDRAGRARWHEPDVLPLRVRQAFDAADRQD